jgi:primosomal protein N' (replication factor Y)
MPPLEHCPKCSAVDSFVACGPGVERIAEECATLFPEARLLVLSSDMAGGLERLRQEIEAVARGEADIVIGTQLVAKGHHFPGLALVGVIDADLALAQGDPRAGERTFQVLQQVVGRAGRAKDGSRALLQTHMPDHPVIDAIVKGDREAFYAAEIEMREAALLPPFGRLAALVISGDDQASPMAYARMLVRASPRDAEVTVLGPAEAPIALVRGRHRVRLLARSRRAYDLSAYLSQWLSSVEAPRGGVRLEVDVDPQSFL